MGKGALIVKGAVVPPKCGDGLFKPNFRVGFVAPSGGGKTTSCVKYIQDYQKQDVFDRYVLISPSGCVDEKTGIRAEPKWGIIHIDDEYRELNSSVIEEIEDTQKDAISEYKKYLEDLELYKKWLRDEDSLTYQQLVYLWEKYDFKKPESPNNGKERYPHCLIIFDDCVSDTQKKFLANFISKSRHSLCSVFICSQHYTQISRAARKSLSGLCFFRNADKKVRKELYQEYASSDMTEQQFEELMGKLVERHHFLKINLDEMETCKRYVAVVDN